MPISCSTDDPLALLIGMLLDQQVPMEWAFQGPHTLKERLGEARRRDDRGDAGRRPQGGLLQRSRPCTGSRARWRKRAQALCQALVDDYDGDAARVWTTATSGDELLARVRALPGFGVEKAKIFLALLGKRLGVAPDGVGEAAKPFSDATQRSVADIDSAEALAAGPCLEAGPEGQGQGQRRLNPTLLGYDGDPTGAVGTCRSSSTFCAPTPDHAWTTGL